MRFAFLRYTISLKKNVLGIVINETKTTFKTPSLMLSRVSRQPQIFTSSFDWFTGLPVPFVIGRVVTLILNIFPRSETVPGFGLCQD